MHAIYFSYKIKNPTFNELSMMISVTQVLRRPRLVSPVFSCHGQTFSSAAAAVKSTRDTGDYDSYYIIMKPSDLDIQFLSVGFSNREPQGSRWKCLEEIQWL